MGIAKPLLSAKARLFLALWAAVFAAVIASDASFYFAEAHTEWGDAAVNALQIANAKSFNELHGNYSRWQFHHPGPAFFYVYAWAELFLHDLLHLVRSPHNAHVLAGVLLQALFFAWSLAIIARHVERRLLTPTLLLLAALHFGLVNVAVPHSVFASIWPPHVLLFPFFCFLVAAASVCTGNARDLIPMTFAGSMLVHGHVAQPLFVAPIAALAFTALVWRFRGTSAEKRRTTYVCVAIATGVAALFILPIAIDALSGPRSNLSAILQHLSTHADDRKTWGQSLVYLLTFFCYIPDPERYCDQLSAASFQFLTLRWQPVAGWLLLCGATLFLYARSRDRLSAETKRFALGLFTIFAAAVVLTLIWGRMQNGPLYNFNSYFNYSLLLIPVVFFAIVMASHLNTPAAVWSAPYIYGVALLAIVAGSKNFKIGSQLPDSPSDAVNLNAQVAAAVKAEESYPRRKYLAFEPDSWPHAAAVALALRRAGYEFAVPPHWSFMFGTEAAAEFAPAIGNDSLSLWRVSSASDTTWISHGARPIDPSRTTDILFSAPDANVRTFAYVGWDVSGAPYAWTVGSTAVLQFAALPATADVVVTVELFREEFSRIAAQRMNASFNGESLASAEIRGRQTVELVIPQAAWNKRARATLAFEFPDAISPAAAGTSPDVRPIACGFVRLQFRTVDGAANQETLH